MVLMQNETQAIRIVYDGSIQCYGLKEVGLNAQIFFMVLNW